VLCVRNGQKKTLKDIPNLDVFPVSQFLPMKNPSTGKKNVFFVTEVRVNNNVYFQKKQFIVGRVEMHLQENPCKLVS